MVLTMTTMAALAASDYSAPGSQVRCILVPSDAAVPAVAVSVTAVVVLYQRVVVVAVVVVVEA